ncbi:MAG: NAD-dependent epimerase/dehydratase family protein [Candidatus Cloacimonetes bacterium]|jgi:UDP-glucose 4-epimerase|nr:NAD-dependent epimerase/dehydratase family protein [Candidatus Cloacimonadota bacterium]HOH82802.1 NAD-dependent epimerase/dehydratase family protein [Candidatus Syntrophosphaera thermopropionivorans]HRQ98919.1 NAD-dependent epimerase/dehydratase family protein [Candidatus Syntrophosphaera sp.]HON32599.1 NAD-dependent epimerase/dehydratase family protein [Candidatus Syntrophosphaera thermopropionivorans]HOT39828.1 NAD-dependent epimerase/dehydratase family protein [Candidatus Syntrophosphaer
MKRKILITGGAGFIGSNVADAYLADGYEVVVVDDLSSGSLENLDSRVKFYQLNICSPALEEIFAREKPDVVNHHAAQISVPYSIENPINDAEINLKGFLNVLQCSVKHGVRKVILISSGGAIYGEAEEYPASENCPLNPLSIYAIHKLTSEYYVRFYQYQYNLTYTILRYANVYGPRQVAQSEAGVVSIFIEKLLHNQAPMLYAYPDEPEGMIRDYVYVKDVVRANVAALDKGDNDVFNIGTGQETTTSFLYRTIAWQLGTDLRPIPGPPRKGDLRRSLLDCSKAFKELGWSPLYTLDAGIRETIEFFKNKESLK